MTDKVQNDWAGPRVEKDMGDGTFAPVEYVGQTDASGNVRVTLATQIAGEDLNNNALITETNTVVTKTQNAVSLANSASNSSSGIATGNYRKFRTVAAGTVSCMTLRLYLV